MPERAGDQWTVLEMWLSACVALVLNKTSRNQLSPPAFYRSLARLTFLLHAKVQIFLVLRIVIESVTETVNGQ